jgi:AraC-like DNA-binding protein
MSSRLEGATAAKLTAYYWRNGFVLLAPTFHLDRSRQPYHRLSATLMVARRNPFTLETGIDDRLTARAVLIGPKVERRRIAAIESDLMICDLALTSPEYASLAPLLEGRSVCELDASQMEPLASAFDTSLSGELSADELRTRLGDVIARISGHKPQATVLHPRVIQVMRLIEDHPLDTTTLEWLAGQVHLSSSRLRHLFKEQTGSSLSHYLRWNAVWKGVWLWSRGQSLTEIGQAVGFHDSAHLNRAFNEIFGLNPSTLVDPAQFKLIRCDWDGSLGGP